jgi:2-polyprenyl-3-methyl-5-hydroxy-6-metoxy-1,4-benzoquinol methylase
MVSMPQNVKLFTREIEQELLSHGYGPLFRETYLDRFLLDYVDSENISSAVDIKDLVRFAKDSVVDYVLGISWRGNATMQYICSKKKIGAGQRFLDIGCGFGGTLLAFGKIGAEVAGIELDRIRAVAARSLLDDNNVRGTISYTDVFSSEFDSFGNFDVVSTENVIEHVDDPIGFIKRIAERASTPGALLYFEIPNSHCLSLVMQDPHYRMPLLTLLPHHAAKAAFTSTPRLDRFGGGYQVGEYYNKEFYYNEISNLGFDVKIERSIHSSIPIDKAWMMLSDIVRMVPNIGNIYSECKPILKEEVYFRLTEYISEVTFALTRFRVAPDRDEIVLDYLSPSWHVFATRR